MKFVSGHHGSRDPDHSARDIFGLGNNSYPYVYGLSVGGVGYF